MQSSQYWQVFSLPPELLNTLTPRNLVNRVPTRPPSPEPTIPVVATGQRACNICLGTTFLGVDEQRNHFKSDWHRYNVKVRLNGGQNVTEPDFAQLVDALDDSISGSASSSEEGSDSDAVNTLVNKTKRLGRRSPTPDSSPNQIPQTALTWFHSPPSTQIGVYKALFPLHTEPPRYLDALKAMQIPQPDGRTWALFMVAGGHFAGAIVRVSRAEDEGEDEELGSKAGKKKPKKPKPEIEVLNHKTFHRYTTRKKQGGSQSTNDNAKGFAKSAGALLRRYGEQALRDDIRNLLAEWAEDLHLCERIWIRASTSNRRIFLDYDSAVIHKGDDRLRTFPFPTRRPTQSELTRCLAELTRPKISHLTEEALRVQDEAYLASLPKPKPIPVPVVPVEREKTQAVKLSKEEETLREKWSRLLEMVNKGRLEPLKTFWGRENTAIGGIDTQIPEWAGEKTTTILQAAAHSGHEDVTLWLLEEVRADPTVVMISAEEDDLEKNTNDGNQSDSSDVPRKIAKGGGRTAYDLAQTKAVRDVFRRCAAAHPDWWDWLGAGHVPSVLSQGMEDEREQKKKLRRKGLKDRVKEREAREQEQERPNTLPAQPESSPKSLKDNTNVGSQKLGGASGAVEGVAGLTPDMRAKVERERRARAAEARLKVFGGK